MGSRSPWEGAILRGKGRPTVKYMDTLRSLSAKTAESIEMPFGLWARMAPRNHVLDESSQVLRDVAMATVSWISIYGVHIGTTWRIRLNCPCAAAMQPYVKLP